MNKYLSVAVSVLIVISVIAISATGQAEGINHKAFPAQAAKDPYGHSSEPAPMGIVDYGIGPNGYEYSFNSTSFTGIVHIKNLKTYNSSITSCPDDASIQLNLIYRFNDSGSNYTYWVQNVAIINTSSSQVAFLDNVWNFTSDNSAMHNSTISGNGKVTPSGSGNYYGSTGNFLNLNNKTMELRSISYLANGVPHLKMEYNNGNGWKTYDNITFTFASNVSINHGFIVNGNKLTAGHSIDAGLIIGGPGNGTTTKVINANITMALEYWNGHNYQAVEDACNYGSDTAEGVYNAHISYNSSSEIPMANIETGNTNLGGLYNSSSIAVINFTANLNGSYIKLNGVQYNYTGEFVNLTLNPGNYDLELYSTEGQLIYQHNYTLTAGNYYALSTKQTYRVIFTENGLASGSRWRVDVNGSLLSSTGNNITFYLDNGIYNYSTPSVSGYSAYHGSGSFTVNASTDHFNITFKKVPEVYNNSINDIFGYKAIISAIIMAAVLILAVVALKPERHEKK